MTIQYIIETTIWNRPKGSFQMTDEYLAHRLDFFHKYTLRSILNQSYKDFKIFVQLGSRFKETTDNYEWHHKVIRCHNMGYEEYKKINADYLIILRIDSDDLFHKHALKAVDRLKELSPRERRVMVFRENICWDQINKMIVPHRKATSPFFVHIFPKKIYKKWKLFVNQHFRIHGEAGDRKGVDLPEKMVCVIKHGMNVSLLKRGLKPFTLTDDQLKNIKQTGKSDYNLMFYDQAIWRPEQMRMILKDFGVDYHDKT